jgi:hypothetical protein
MIYHYTSVKGFYEIIKSKELWLFNSRKMNDYVETNWINPLIEDEIKAVKDIVDKETLSLLSTYYNMNKSHAYLMCFSKEWDILSQWRSYADNGKGVVIAFDEKFLEIKNKIPYENADANLTIGLHECIYDLEVQKRIIHESFNVDLLEKNFGYESILANELIGFLLIFKNQAFQEEKETRIIYTPKIATIVNKDSSEINIAGAIPGLSFTLKGNDVSSYFKFNIMKIFSSTLIPKIYLGPKNEMEIDDLSLFLSSMGLKNTKIEYSKATYR